MSTNGTNDLIERLESQKRFWKRLAIGSMTFGCFILVVGVTSALWLQARSRAEALRAMDAERAARMQAERLMEDSIEAKQKEKRARSS